MHKRCALVTGIKTCALPIFFHTVKGSWCFRSLPRFEKLSHAAEVVLSEIRAGNRMPDPATVSAVLAIMDRIGELCQAVASGAPLSSLNDDILIEELSQCEEIGRA